MTVVVNDVEVRVYEVMDFAGIFILTGGSSFLLDSEFYGSGM